MPNPEVVNYLRQHLDKFPVDELRKQLTAEGIGEADFDEALKFVLRTPLPKEPKASKAGLVFLLAGVALVLVIGVFTLLQQRPAGEDKPRPQPQEGAYLGRSGYVVKLPAGYEAVERYADDGKTTEIVHFCKRGTDHTSFLDEGLFGQLGIVRLEVEPNRFIEHPNPPEGLKQFLRNMYSQRGDKFTITEMKVSTLKGAQVVLESPYQRTEAYILGEKTLYAFTAGQDDEIYRDIVLSLRETSGEM